MIHRVNLHIHDMLQKGQISKGTCSYLTTDIDGTQQFYLLPKIHKNPKNPLGRSIVLGSGGPTERISQFVDYFIRHLLPFYQSFNMDSTHLISTLNVLTIQPRILLCNLDITSLYTNIPHNEVIHAIKEMLAIHRPPNDLPCNSYTIEFLEVVLTNYHFEFNGLFYRQVAGTAMGRKLEPSYPNLFMTKFEEKYVYT